MSPTWQLHQISLFYSSFSFKYNASLYFLFNFVFFSRYSMCNFMLFNASIWHQRLKRYGLCSFIFVFSVYNNNNNDNNNYTTLKLLPTFRETGKICAQMHFTTCTSISILNYRVNANNVHVDTAVLRPYTFFHSFTRG